MPRSNDGSSSSDTFQSYVVESALLNAHIVASQQAPPPSRNSTTLAGSAGRTQNANSLPSAHWQSPPGTMRCHAAPLDDVETPAS